MNLRLGGEGVKFCGGGCVVLGKFHLSRQMGKKGLGGSGVCYDVEWPAGVGLRGYRGRGVRISKISFVYANGDGWVRGTLGRKEEGRLDLIEMKGASQPG